MKTLKFLSIVAIFVLIAGTSNATTYNLTHYEVKSSTDIPKVIKRLVQNDIVSLHNYFQENDIYRIKETVEFEFYIDKNNRIKVLNTESDSEVACEYVKQLLDDQELSTDKSVLYKKYKIKLNITYFA